MILPPEPWEIICFAASCVQTITPHVLTRRISLKFASSTSMKSRARFMPALLKITLSAPKVSTGGPDHAPAPARDRSRRRRPTRPCRRPSTISSATACAAAASRSATTTFAPSAAIARQAAAPIPPAPPVTITTRSCTRPIAISFVSDSRHFTLEQVCAAHVGLAAHEQLLGRELRDDPAAVGGDDDLLLDARGRLAVARRRSRSRARRPCPPRSRSGARASGRARSSAPRRGRRRARGRTAGRSRPARRGSRAPAAVGQTRGDLVGRHARADELDRVSSHSRHCL